jgi:hypothetical protein
MNENLLGSAAQNNGFTGSFQYTQSLPAAGTYRVKIRMFTVKNM